MPILEAMAFGKPVLCSNVTSLPEVGGDAAIYFDPRKPDSIVNALESLDGNPQLLASLAERGRLRLISFGSTEQMASDYMSVFRKVKK